MCRPLYAWGLCFSEPFEAILRVPAATLGGEIGMAVLVYTVLGRGNDV